MSAFFRKKQPPEKSLPMALPPVGGRILLVEDNALILELWELVLAGAGYQTATVASGDQAWRLLHERTFDLLVTDNTMPGLRGLGLVDLVRQSGNLIPVIVASGSAGPHELETGKWPGYVKALPKPFLMTELLDEVKAALRHAPDAGLGNSLPPVRPDRNQPRL
jgi:CheY-like chemotaxis protein